MNVWIAAENNAVSRVNAQCGVRNNSLSRFRAETYANQYQYCIRISLYVIHNGD
jgi:hypothetical protein